MLKRFDPEEEEADRLLVRAESGSRKHVEYPCYSEKWLDLKRRRHEDCYETPPEVECDSFPEIHEMAIADLLHFGEVANLTAKQQYAWTLHCCGFSVRDITACIQREEGSKISWQAIAYRIGDARTKIERAVRADPYYGWYVVYLETVLRRPLY